MTLRAITSWAAALLAGATAYSGVGYALTAYTLSRWLTRPYRAKPTTAGLDPIWTIENVECRTADGQRLAGWVVEPPNPAGVVAIFHGLRQCRKHLVERINILAGAGYRCVAFDLRAHGQSTGRATSFGWHEGRDVAAVVGWMQNRWPTEPMAALGVSMGAAAMCFAGSHLNGLQAVILESLYHDMASAFSNRMKSGFPPWYRRFSSGVMWVTEKRLGVNTVQIAPAEHIAQFASAPVLLLTGTDDIHAGPSDAERLQRRCAGPCELVLVEGADHFNLCTHRPAVYRDAVVDFLGRHLLGERRSLAA